MPFGGFQLGFPSKISYAHPSIRNHGSGVGLGANRSRLNRVESSTGPKKCPVGVFS